MILMESKMKNEQEYLDTIDIQHEVIEHLEDQITWIASVIYYQEHLRKQDEWLEEMIKLGHYTPDTDEDDLTEKEE